MIASAMLIKKTQQKGFSISTENGETILKDKSIEIHRKDPSDDQDEVYSITTPGEYDVADISILSLNPYPIFMIICEGFTVSYLSEPHDEIPNEALSHLEQTDVLLIPGKSAELVSKFAPSYVIPLDDGPLVAEKMGIDLPDTSPSLKLNRVTDLPEDSEIINLG